MGSQSFIARILMIGAMVSGGAASALAQRPGPRGNVGGYIPWRGQGFGGYVVQGPAPSQPSPGQEYDLGPAIAQAEFAKAQFQNRWNSLQMLLTRARDDFQASKDYLEARAELDQARSLYEAAQDTVLARLQNNRTYRDLIAKRTQEQIALRSTAPDSGLRTDVATTKMHYGAMASEMEAVALADDPAVQDARRRLIAAQEALTLKQRQFQSWLNQRPEIAAAWQAVTSARANEAGAEGFLRGQEIMRADQLNMYWGSYSGNLVGWGPWGP